MVPARICAFLLLFFNQTWAEEGDLKMIDLKQEVGQGNGNVTVDVWEELKELRDMVFEQKIELSNSRSRIMKLEEEKSEVISRVTVNENKVAELDVRASTSEAKVEELKRQITESPKVAFSLALTNSRTIGPFTTDITLKFNKVFTNVGQAYNTYTGVFTAPFRGVYYFRVTVFCEKNNQWTGAKLYHNDKRVTWIADYNDDVGYITASNAFVLEMEKGDVVYLDLPANYAVYDDSLNRTVFSGFLIYPL